MVTDLIRRNLDAVSRDAGAHERIVHGPPGLRRGHLVRRAVGTWMVIEPVPSARYSST